MARSPCDNLIKHIQILLDFVIALTKVRKDINEPGQNRLKLDTKGNRIKDTAELGVLRTAASRGAGKSMLDKVDRVW